MAVATPNQAFDLPLAEAHIGTAIYPVSRVANVKEGYVQVDATATADPADPQAMYELGAGTGSDDTRLIGPLEGAGTSVAVLLRRVSGANVTTLKYRVFGVDDAGISWPLVNANEDIEVELDPANLLAAVNGAEKMPLNLKRDIWDLSGFRFALVKVTQQMHVDDDAYLDLKPV